MTIAREGISICSRDTAETRTLINPLQLPTSASGKNLFDNMFNNRETVIFHFSFSSSLTQCIATAADSPTPIASLVDLLLN